MEEYDWKIINTIYHTGSISKAAEILYTTQPTLSKKLIHMEQDLGVRIVERNSKGVHFTPEGVYLAEESASLLKQFACIRSRLSDFGKKSEVTLNIGMTNAFARFTVPPLLHAYSEENPGVRFNVRIGLSSEVIEWLDQGAIQVGFIRAEPAPRHSKFLVSTDQAMLIHTEPVKLMELPHLPRVYYQQDRYTVELFDHWWKQWFTLPPQNAIQANHGGTCYEMVKSKLGYSVFMSPDFINDEDVLFKMPLYYPDGTPLVRNSWLIWKEDEGISQEEQSFIESMKQALQNRRMEARL